MALIRLGELLVKAKVLNENQLKLALTEQKRWGGHLGEILVRMSLVSEDLLVRALAKQLNLPAVNLEGIANISDQVRAKIPLEIARDLVALPLQLRNDAKTLVVAMAGPQNMQHLDTLRHVSGCKIEPQIAGRQMIARAFGRFYQGQAPVSLSNEDGSFKIINSQGVTVLKANASAANGAEPIATPRPSAPPPNARADGARPSAVQILQQVEETQRREISAIKTLVDLLIEKGVFTRDEYLAKIKR